MKTVQTTANTGAQQTASPPVPETTKLQRRPSAVVLALVLAMRWLKGRAARRNALLEASVRGLGE